MVARTTRNGGTLQAVEPPARREGMSPEEAAKPSEIAELVYQLMIERGAVPRPGRSREERHDDEVRMAEAP